VEKCKLLAILILAAGNSSRLKEPKQLLKYKGNTLLYNSCKNALAINSNVYVVLGANYKECENEIKSLNVNIIKNETYKDGISSSIKQGILKLQKYEKTLIILCDQPFIEISHFKELIKKSQNSQKIICSFYNNDVAVPAIFPKNFYTKLLMLKKDKGAKNLIKKEPHEKVILDNKKAIDIDVQKDKIYLQKSLKS